MRNISQDIHPVDGTLFLVRLCRCIGQVLWKSLFSIFENGLQTGSIAGIELPMSRATAKSFSITQQNSWSPHNHLFPIAKCMSH